MTQKETREGMCCMLLLEQADARRRASHETRCQHDDARRVHRAASDALEVTRRHWTVATH